MELNALIDALSKPSAYPFPAASIEIHQTHISVVFLAGAFAYKVKKPVNLGFLDFSTLEKRRHYCEEEIRLNRRLAPDVYLGVVPITHNDQGVQVKGNGDAVEWAVKMKRLPADATLDSLLGKGQIQPEAVRALARKVAEFHARAESGPPIWDFAKFDAVARNARENFEQARAQVGAALSQSVLDRLLALTEKLLAMLRPLIESRASRGMPRDTHGDLHLDHVYLFPEQPPPGDLVIVDCIEFNERFRYADPVADMAFLVMDFISHGRRDLADMFADEYFRAAGDDEGKALLPFYVAYRAAVRGKVEGLEMAETEIPEAERTAALARARAHWLLALGELETPERKPCLVMIGGLPGSGKSTLARGLADAAGSHVIRSDEVRKEIAGLAPVDRAAAEFGEGIYTTEWTERTYKECLRRAETLLFKGKRVIVDATFAQERHRQAFAGAAKRLSVPALFFHCQADPETVRQRLAARRGDASDANEDVYRGTSERWEPLGPVTSALSFEIATLGGKDEMTARGLERLRRSNLA